MGKLLNSRLRAAVLVAACLALVMSSTVRPRADASISQNFDAMGTAAAATLPAGFHVDKLTAVRTVGSYAAAGTATTARGGNALSSTASQGIYNFGAGAADSATDRAIGFLSSGSGTSSGNLYFKLTNATADTLTGLPVSYQVEKYRGGSNAAGFRIQLFYSFDGSTWTDAGPAFTTAFARDASNSGYAPAPGVTVPVSATLAVTIPAGSDLYLAWNYSVTSGSTVTNAQALAIDDIVIGGVGSTQPYGNGTATPASALPGGSSLLTVAVTGGSNPPSTGLAVTADLTTIGGTTGTTFYDDGTHGDQVAGDNIFSFQATVDSNATDGAEALPFNITDSEGRSAIGSISFSVLPPPPPVLEIHDIQGAGDVSPYKGKVVNTSGIVTGVKADGTSKGFFIQAEQPDTDPRTSEGIFVYTGAAPTVTTGDFVTVIGKVQEYGTMTEISGPVTVTWNSGNNPLPAATPVSATDAIVTDGVSGLERYEGMRVRVDSLTVVAPTDYGEFYGVFPGVPRPFREPGLDPLAPPLTGMPAGVPQFDGNLERLGVDGIALGGSYAVDVTTNATVTNISGVLDFANGAYTIDSDAMPSFTGNISPMPVPVATEGQFTVASWNMLNFTNDATRMSKASMVIRDILHMPDIIGVEEMKDLPTLETLAARVNADAGATSPGYKAQLLATTGTQNVGFLVKSTVTGVSVTEVGRDATFVDPRDGSVDTLNDRPPLVLTGNVSIPRGGSFPITVVVNHLRSLLDVDANSADGKGLYARLKRKLGAEYLAQLLQQHQQNGEHVISIGDYNAFQFNDGYVDVIGTIVGQPAPSDQVLLASTDLVEPNFTDLIDTAAADERYSYTENGNAQTIDHIIVSPNMLSWAAGLAYGRVDADFPYNYSTDHPNTPERASDHDPVVAYFNFPATDVSVTASATPSNPVLTGSPLEYTVTAHNGLDRDATNVTVTAALPAGVSFGTATGPDGWTCTSSGTSAATVTCNGGVLKAGTDAVFTITATLDCLVPTSQLSTLVTIQAAEYDPNETNNSSTVVTEASNPVPKITVDSPQPSLLWPVNHAMVPVTIGYSVADNCGPAPACALSVSSNEPASRGDGHTASDWQILDAHNLLLRAERAGTGDGRTYTITITCTDAGGNAGTKNVFVTVPKSQGQQK